MDKQLVAKSKSQIFLLWWIFVITIIYISTKPFLVALIIGLSLLVYTMFILRKLNMLVNIRVYDTFILINNINMLNSDLEKVKYQRLLKIIFFKYTLGRKHHFTTLWLQKDKKQFSEIFGESDFSLF